MDQQESQDLENELLAALEDDSGDDVCYSNTLPTRLDQSPGQALGQPIGNPGVLGRLSDTALWRILCCLSAEDLCSLSCCSAYWRRIASDSTLWARLYVWRWPEGHTFENQEDEREDQVNWKHLYMQRDESELVSAMQDAREEFDCFYLQIAKAKRSQSLGLVQADAVFAAHTKTASNSMSARISQFKKERKLDSPQKACQECKYTHLEGSRVYICERCGKTHLCGDSCRDFIVERGSNLAVCPISGRCMPHFMSEQEELAEAGGPANNEEGPGDDWNAEQHIGGRLGRAFFAGYNAVDEKEMLQRFGVKL